MKIGAIVTTLVLLPACAAQTPDAAAPPKQAEPTAQGPLAALAWMTGAWRGSSSDGDLEEAWSTPASDMMMGMGRVVSQGRTVFHEFMTIAAQHDGLVFTAMVDGKQGVPFRLEARHDSTWIFANPEHDFPKRVIYRREADGSLFARIEGEDASKGQDFRMSRAR